MLKKIINNTFFCKLSTKLKTIWIAEIYDTPSFYLGGSGFNSLVTLKSPPYSGDKNELCWSNLNPNKWDTKNRLDRGQNTLRWVPDKFWRRPHKQTSKSNNLIHMKTCMNNENVFISNKRHCTVAYHDLKHEPVPNWSGDMGIVWRWGSTKPHSHKKLWRHKAPSNRFNSFIKILEKGD